jgi:hypothetical protein
MQRAGICGPTRHSYARSDRSEGGGTAGLALTIQIAAKRSRGVDAARRMLRRQLDRERSDPRDD